MGFINKLQNDFILTNKRQKELQNNFNTFKCKNCQQLNFFNQQILHTYRREKTKK
uniref:Uncharacterized protein n=1 Tax=Octopus bimaculoides TaxID=37653 RepID=A0A0L8H930_OCTBM